MEQEELELPQSRDFLLPQKILENLRMDLIKKQAL
jgi:hypothetical protein